MKLLKMNTSLETLRLNNCSKNTNNYLNKDLWLAIGDNQSLKLLDLSFSGKLKEPNSVGNGVALNSKRKGSL